MRKKKNYIYKNFLTAKKELKELKTYILLSSIIFLFFIILGLVFPSILEERILEMIKSLVSQTQDKTILGLISFITANNIQVAFFGIITGIALGILPIMALVINGYVIGFVIHHSIAEAGILVLWKLFPHGIFELPAILISTALGIKLGTDLKNIKKNFISSIRIFLLIIIPLLVIAGIIEGTLIGLGA